MTINAKSYIFWGVVIIKVSWNWKGSSPFLAFFIHSGGTRDQTLFFAKLSLGNGLWSDTSFPTFIGWSLSHLYSGVFCHQGFIFDSNSFLHLMSPLKDEIVVLYRILWLAFRVTRLLSHSCFVQHSLTLVAHSLECWLLQKFRSALLSCCLNIQGWSPPHHNCGSSKAAFSLILLMWTECIVLPDTVPDFSCIIKGFARRADCAVN